MKLLIIAAIFSFSSLTIARAPGTYYQVKSELEKVSSRELVSFVNDLVKTSAPSRMVGKPGHAEAVKFLTGFVQKADPKNTGKLSVLSFDPDIAEAKRFYQNDFSEKVEGKVEASSPDYLKWKNFTSYITNYVDRMKGLSGQTIVWEKQGLNSKKILVVTAHYDTISVDPNSFTIKDADPMPGANYNASGVAVAMGILKTLAQIDLNYTVQVVFLDWQGVGFLGSYEYAKELKSLASSGKEILGVVNLEMLGQDSSFLDKTKKTGNMSVYLRPVTSEEKWAKVLVQHGSQMKGKVSFEIKPNSFENSDTFRFWEKDIQAVTFSQNWEDDFNPKFYQTALDTPETLNHDTLYGAYRFIGGAVLGTLLDITK